MNYHAVARCSVAPRWCKPTSVVVTPNRSRNLLQYVAPALTLPPSEPPTPFVSGPPGEPKSQVRKTSDVEICFSSCLF